jgi:hypothetical protein
LDLLSAGRRLHEVAAPPAFECQDAGTGHSPEPDAATTRYMLATRDAFESLRQVVTQIAALLILAASKSRDWCDHPMIDVTMAARQGMRDAIRAVTVPAGASHVHSHFVNAGHHVDAALSIIAARRTKFDDAALDAALAAVQAAQREMQWSSAAVPGLEMIAFSQGCCAMHRNNKIIEI